MTIANADELINSMGNNSSRLILDKNNSSTLTAAAWVAGNYYSLWKLTGQPGAGATPTTAAVCSNSLVGSFQFAQQTSPATSYLGIFEAVQPNAAVTLEIHDRLAHNGGLSGTNNGGAQAVDIDLDLVLGTSNLSARKGDANYSDVQWWLEWYVATGGTGVNATVNVTYNDSTSCNLTAFALGTSVQNTRMIALNPYIPSADSGKYIMRVNTVTLSGTTGTQGNFGVTATRYRASVFMPIANARFTSNWADLGLPEIYNSSCLFCVAIAGATTSGIVKGTGKVVHG
jgi:hypothetical protein